MHREAEWVSVATRFCDQRGKVKDSKKKAASLAELTRGSLRFRSKYEQDMEKEIMK